MTKSDGCNAGSKQFARQIFHQEAPIARPVSTSVTDMR
jgi:hypothetical protein